MPITRRQKKREHQRLDKLNDKNNNRNVRGANDLISYGFKKFQINQKHKEASAKAREQAAEYMKKKYGNSYAKQKESRYTKQAIAASLGALAMYGGVALYSMHKLNKMTAKYRNTNSFPRSGGLL